jgi:hypothetical protein
MELESTEILIILIAAGIFFGLFFLIIKVAVSSAIRSTSNENKTLIYLKLLELRKIGVSEDDIQKALIQDDLEKLNQKYKAGMINRVDYLNEREKISTVNTTR